MSNIFTTIYHSFRCYHKLTLNEYVLCDTIYYLSTRPDSKVLGWCYKSKVNLASDLGLSKQTIMNLLNTLIEKGFLIRDSETSFLKTTKKWNDVYQFTSGKDSLPSSKNFVESGKESLPESGKESLPNNNNIYSNINKDESKDSYNGLFSENNSSKPPIEKEKNPTKKVDFTSFHFRKKLIDLGADENHVNDFMQVRKHKKASNTETALNSFLKQCTDNNFPVKDAVKLCAENDWKGFRYSWIKDQQEIKSQDKIEM